MISNTQKISIVIPVYNEAGGLNELYDRVCRVVEKLSRYSFEFVFVDDGSRDDSWEILRGLVSEDSRIKVIKFSRNFGHQVALIAGYDAASGDAIVTIDGDLEHPPEYIPEMVNKWEQGAKVVYARKVVRGDNFLKRWMTMTYYWLLDKITSVKIPRNVSDFRLIDRVVLDAIKGRWDQFSYLRGMVAWTGFQQDYVNIKCGRRAYGKSAYTFLKMFKLAFDGITGFSLFPLKIAAFVGSFVVVTGSAMFLYITVDYLIYGVWYPLFKWLVTFVYIFMGIQFLLLWLLGEYVGRIHDRQKRGPAYIIEQRLGKDEGN